MSSIVHAFEELEFGPVQSFRNLTVVPLIRRPDAHVLDPATYLTLDEAVARDLLVIQELSDGASVPALQALNRADKPVLLVDGDALMGAKQNRVINLTILVPAGCTVVIPVSCVEAGRWRSSSDRFRPATHALYAQARAEKMSQVSESLANRGEPAADQGAVWEGIRLRSASMHTSSPTEAMSDIYERHADGVDEYARAIHAVPGQVGAVFAVNGDVAGLELFGHTATLVAQFLKILRGYGLDAIAAAGHVHRPTDAGNARAFVEQVADAAATSARTFPGVGLGQTVRIDKDGVIGAALVVDDRPVHVSAFRKEYAR